MYAVIRSPGRLFSKVEAENLAAQLNADEDEEWEYRCVHCPKGTGYSFIEIYDENGELAGKL